MLSCEKDPLHFKSTRECSVEMETESSIQSSFRRLDNGAGCAATVACNQFDTALTADQQGKLAEMIP